jgi:putative membrane protein insertion efficiency factor
MIARLLVLLIRGYQRTLSPLIGPVCRFSPSCSNYMLVCIRRFGPLKGIWLGMRRLARCHPFHAGGEDLPPEAPADHTAHDCASQPSVHARNFERTP